MRLTTLKKSISAIWCALFIGVIFFFSSPVVHAQQAAEVGLKQTQTAAGFSDSNSLPVVVGKIINGFLGVLGVIVVGMIVYAGFLIVTAAGNEEQVGRGKKILVNSVIGVLLIFSSYAIASFIIKRIGGATTDLPAHCFDQIQNNGESATDCGGECGSCDGGGGGGSFNGSYSGGSLFYVASLPKGGDVCVRNIHLGIVFNKEVDLTTLDKNVVIVKKDDGQEISGKWQYGSRNEMAVFVPDGSCNPDQGNDCLLPSTAYQLVFKNGSAVKSIGKVSLTCSVKAGCAPVDFVSGKGVDRVPPTISFTMPKNNASFAANKVIPVTVNFSDDNGVQNVSLFQGNTLISSESVEGCQKNGSVNMSWNTSAVTPGNYSLLASDLDWSGMKGSSEVGVNILPAHCFNDVLDKDLGEQIKGPPACGGECGICGGDACVNNSQCASGYCDTVAGVCVDKMRIDSISPASGAIGTLVSISGYYFGTQAGEVYFAKVKNPSKNKLDDWIKGTLATCGGGFKNWSSTQILVEVPVGAVTGPIMVITTGSAEKDKVTDLTNDDWGVKITDFEVTNQVRPGICGINPTSGLSGTAVVLVGKNFGLLDSASDQLVFGEVKTQIGGNDWSDSLIKATVPLLPEGAARVKVLNNGVESNEVDFNIEKGQTQQAPTISSISPAQGAAGDYITIVGNNFGESVGAVWFKRTQDSEAILGDFSFPEECKRGVWNSNQIIVKFPKNKGQAGSSYLVQIKTTDNKVSSFDANVKFTLQEGDPAPGVCSISPVSGPIPFPVGEGVTLKGENFGTQPQVYFWGKGAVGNSLSGRAQVDKNSYFFVSETSVTVYPPSNVVTGPVVVYRSDNKKMSNPATFSVFDCSKNNNSCTNAAFTCCTSGVQNGLCKPKNELCQGGALSSGYIWRFSTKDIPEMPHVVERCDDATDAGKNIPSPSPSVEWDQTENGDQHNVCRTALATVEFSLPLDQKTITKNNLLVNKCDSVNANNCVNPQPVALSNQSYILKTASRADGAAKIHQFVQIIPDEGSWNDVSWYQVVLTKQIKTDGIGSLALPLSADKPCTVADSAYCFVFKTDSRNCRLKAVVVTPYSYWTSVLEAPIKYHSLGGGEQEVRYEGNGLSDQHCVMMDVSGFDWGWDTANRTYAAVFGESRAQSARMSALANTVGLGLKNPDNAVNIKATASTGTISYTGVSPLTIDLNNPEVVDSWPKCLETCTNAEVGVRFNTSMSNRNLPGSLAGGAVQLLKCNDENCRSTTPVLALNDVYLDQDSNYTVLKIANSRFNSKELLPDTIYQVILSSSNTTNVDPLLLSNQLWSASKFGDPASFSKPYNKIYSWRFRTKKVKCTVDHVGVAPVEFYASSVKEKKIFDATPFSSPDSCDASGQKLNAWSYDWSWNSSDPKVASITTFSTKGINPSCTQNCIRKGSDIAAGSASMPVCGNGVVEAGEDCDMPDKNKGCSLNCLFLGNTKASCGNGAVEPNLGEACDPKDPATSVGCSSDCRHLGSTQQSQSTDLNASICGNGYIGSGESCDLGIAASSTNPFSALFCSEKCLHLGTRLSRKWYQDNISEGSYRGGFSADEFTAAGASAASQCGDKVLSPDEDPGCDGNSGTGWNSDSCDEHCLKKSDTACTAGTEGCSDKGKKLGSSVFYSTPSMCGDGVVGIGEDSFCDTLSNLLITRATGLINPWTLATGIGLGTPAGDPPAQNTFIRGSVNEKGRATPVTGSGNFVMLCGYENDAQCQDSFGPDFGVGQNTCCYLKPKLTSVYPVDNSTNVCPNTYVEAVFDSPLSPLTLPKNVIVARQATQCDYGADVSSLVASLSNKTQSYAWYNKIIHYVSWVLQHVFGSDALAVDLKWCREDKILNSEVIPVDDATSSTRLVLKLSAPLATSSQYAVILSGDLKDGRGVSVSKVGGKALTWKFAVGPKLCEIQSVRIDPTEYSFSRVGASTTLYARTISTAGSFIQPINKVYDWNYVWGPTTNSFVVLDPTTSTLEHVTALNRNGEIDVRASANIISNQINPTVGLAATGKSHIIVFLCENPWPPKDLFFKGKGPFIIFPYEDKAGNNDGYDLTLNTFDNTPLPQASSIRDGYFNFSTYYCADKGSAGTFDDLPYLRPAVQISDSVVSATTSLKRFIFSNNQNSDAIGIQIFPNPQHLTPDEWFANEKGFVGDNQNIIVDGYKAITDNNNIYVDALNYSSITNNLFTNIYLFSINADAKPETRKVFEQLMSNLHFNNNLTNFGFCGPNLANPGFEKQCNSDLDCAAGEVCSVVTDKLKRNYLRLRDLNLIQNKLQDYSRNHSGKFPSLSEGTYLTGQSLSVWPSWSVLGNEVGYSLPNDPVNLLSPAGTCSLSTTVFCTTDTNCPATEKCVLHDSVTGWSTADRRFSFACATSSYAYRYNAISAGSNYAFRAHFEDTGLVIANQNAFIGSFVSTTNFSVLSSTGICNQDQEISTLNQGSCGDGQVNLNKGEECDPPGKINYGACAAEQAGKIKVNVCTNQCKWTPSSTPFIDCSALSKCGNGSIENGEVCDEGALNGKYNHCNSDCKGFGFAGSCGDGQVQQQNEICDIKENIGIKKGVCLNGAVAFKGCDQDDECNIVNGTRVSYGGVCKIIEETKSKYGLLKKDSCTWDCLNVGPYCGDGVVQSEFGEECEADQECVVGGQPGLRSCNSATCKWMNKEAIAWWRFDGAMVNGAKMSFMDSAGTSTPLCEGAECPQFVSGKVGNAFAFSDGKFVKAPLTPRLELDSHEWLGEQSAITISAWANMPAPSSDGWKNVVVKYRKPTADKKEKSYTFALHFGNNVIDGMAFSSNGGSLGERVVPLKVSINPNEWHQFAVVIGYKYTGNPYSSTYSPGDYTDKFYVDGKFVYGDESLNQSDYGVIGSLTATFDEKRDADRALFLGKDPTAVYPVHIGEWGILDELKIYNRLLADDELLDEYQSGIRCTPGKKIAVTPPINRDPNCGDGNIDSGEACDKGATNGVACIPDYGKTCSYCAFDCKNIIDVHSSGYCGNGKIEGTETCDTDPTTRQIFAAVTAVGTRATKDATHNGYEVLTCESEPQDKSTFKKGLKTCVNSCAVLQPNCVKCGIDPINGVEIRGEIVNVLDPSSSNPLLGSFGQDGTLDAFIAPKRDYSKSIGQIYWSGSSARTYYLKSPTESGYAASSAAKVNSNPMCSAGDPRYTLFVNADDKHPFDFPVFGAVIPGQYDLVLSPLINKDTRPDDIRLVVSWNGDANLIAGFLTPTQVEQTSFRLTNGGQYYTYAATSGIWYHGTTITSGRTHVASFTINTQNYSAHAYGSVLSPRMTNNQYAFYLHTTGEPIKKYLNSQHVKVEVYVPESDPTASAYRHFTTSTMTMYLSNAAPSQNPNATYWNVANILMDSGAVNDIPQNRIIRVEKIISEESLGRGL